MNKIEKLIQELCPEGVKFLGLHDVVDFGRGVRLENADYVPGEYPVVTASRIEAKSHNKHNAGPRIVTITSHGAYAGHVNFWDTPIWLGNNVFSVFPKFDIDPKFLFYYLKSHEGQIQEASKGGGVPYINTKDLFVIRVPLIPMAVQQEIVSILDKFTELEAELEAELDARTSQYESIRGRLIDGRPGSSFSAIPTHHETTLGESVQILNSQRKPVTREHREAGNVPYYGANGIQGYVKNYLFDGTFLLMGEDGSVMTSDHRPILNWVQGKIWVNNHAHVLAEKVGGPSLRYIFYALQSIDISNVVKGLPPKLTQANLRALKLSLPNRETQDLVVSRLDCFVEMISGNQSSLPAENSARRKQYEYYRTKLLTFKELVAV